MSTYLNIAEQVLKIERRPMGPRSILKQAYKMNLVPPHLYGETQHKTLQARLSENILQEKSNSRFFRTEPGSFFLREFLVDTSIPEKHRQPIKARRRIRQLKKGAVLCVNVDRIDYLAEHVKKQNSKNLSKFDDDGLIRFFDASSIPSDFRIITCFSIFEKDNSCLSYRIGRYRHDEDSFTSKRTIGFTSFVSEYDQNLFNRDNLGFVESALAALSIDLDIPISDDGITSDDLSIDGVVYAETLRNEPSVLLVIKATCPDWFEPTARRLSINDMQWLSCRVAPNHLDDFDPWSQAVLERQFE